MKISEFISNENYADSLIFKELHDYRSEPWFSAISELNFHCLELGIKPSSGSISLQEIRSFGRQYELAIESERHKLIASDLSDQDSLKENLSILFWSMLALFFGYLILNVYHFLK